MDAADATFQVALSKLLTEVFDGPPGQECYILNPGDLGLSRQLESLDAAAASKRPMPGRTTIASHAAHLLHGLTMMNRWAAGENPWADADWGAPWKATSVSPESWRELCAGLRREAAAWQRTVATRDQWDDMWAACALSSLAHTAYHLGAIRQIIAAQQAP
jgi:hypothetical protein